MQSIHRDFQVSATRALIKFLLEHDGGVHAELAGCLDALVAGDIDLAVAHAKNVKPHGMGGLTDWFPPVKYANEDAEYVRTLLHALVNHWCHAISLSLPQMTPNTSFERTREGIKCQAQTSARAPLNSTVRPHVSHCSNVQRSA